MELKHCPFCGGKAKVEQTSCGIMETNRGSAMFNFSIRCRKCKATAPYAYGCIAANLSETGELNVWHDDRPSAIEAWNRRVNNG